MNVTISFALSVKELMQGLWIEKHCYYVKKLIAVLIDIYECTLNLDLNLMLKGFCVINRGAESIRLDRPGTTTCTM